MTVVNFRGFDKEEIVNSLHAFCELVRSLDIGSITNTAIDQWMSEGGLLDQIRSSQTKDDIMKALRDNNADKDENLQFGFMMYELYRGALPTALVLLYEKLDDPSMQIDDKALMNFDAADFEQVLNRVGQWGGFGFYSRSVHLHVLTSLDHEFLRYSNRIDGNEYARFISGAFDGPFSEYLVLVSSEKPDVAKTIERIADEEYDMSDHFNSVSQFNGQISASITPQLAEALVERGDLTGDNDFGFIGLLPKKSGSVPMMRRKP